MAAARNLPIYRSAYRLIAHLHQATRKAPRDLRHTLVQQLLDSSIECAVTIASANRASSGIRAAHLETLLEHIARCEILLQVSREQDCISVGASALAMEHIDEMSRQAHGWAKHTTRLTNPVTGVSQSQ